MNRLTDDEITKVDVQLALSRLGGIKSLYHEVLVELPADMVQIAGRIRQSWEAGDLPTLKRELHTLKSLASIVGAEGFASHALYLEFLLKSEPLDESLGQEIQGLEQYCSKIVERIETFEMP